MITGVTFPVSPPPIENEALASLNLPIRQPAASSCSDSSFTWLSSDNNLTSHLDHSHREREWVSNRMCV